MADTCRASTGDRGSPVCLAPANPFWCPAVKHAVALRAPMPGGALLSTLPLLRGHPLATHSPISERAYQSHMNNKCILPEARAPSAPSILRSRSAGSAVLYGGVCLYYYDREEHTVGGYPQLITTLTCTCATGALDVHVRRDGWFWVLPSHCTSTRGWPACWRGLA